MRLATQDDINKFYHSILNDPCIYPYTQLGKYLCIPTIPADQWHDLYLISDNLNCYVHIWIDRCKDNEFTISIFAKNAFAAGRGIIAIKELIRRYSPRAINSSVHASNVKSIAINQKLYGYPGTPVVSAAWNMKTGDYEDLIQFRKIL